MLGRGGLRGRRMAGALAFLLCAAPLSAQEMGAAPARPSPILTIEQEKLFTDTLYGKAMLARAEQETRALQAENRRIEADLEAEEKALTERRATLPQAEFRVLADAFDEKVEGIRKAQEAKSRAFSDAQGAVRQRFFETAAPVLAELMAEMGADVILDKSVVVISFDRIDVTERAVARIDAVLGDGSAPAPAQP
jgi:Skp family chaperone for outer membrane proteins